MTSGSEHKLAIGTRHSKLALCQTGNTLAKLHDLFPALTFEAVHVTTPGDTDRKTDLRVSDPDFFTRDLDDAVLDKRVDAAVHSAKDVPYPVRSGLDWFWLPWHEDPRDVLILPRKDQNDHAIVDNGSLRPSYQPGNIGVSSERREAYCQQRFPNAELRSIRGNIDERIAQLDEGKYDLLIMAAAGLKRLGFTDRISEYIPLDALTPPEGQGYLAITFRQDDQLFIAIRQLFARPVTFLGAGPGNPELITQAGIKALQQCDICLYDALSSPELLNHLSPSAKAVYVGKRSGKHSATQPQICEMIADYARQGKQVVRLKGGDCGIFGRLAEEIDTLEQLRMPYHVIPGISSLVSATTSTGILLTRRGVSRGFTVMTPRKSGSAQFAPANQDERLAFPHVFFMGVSVTAKIARQLLDEGYPQDLPATIVFAAGTDQQEILPSTLSELTAFDKSQLPHDKPGILIVGTVAGADYQYKNFGPLSGKKILLTCSEALQNRAICDVRRFGGIPVSFPLIKLTPEPAVEEHLREMERFDWLVITSPSAVSCLMQLLDDLEIDVRTLPKIMVCGKGTAAEFRRHGILVDSDVPEPFGADALLEKAESLLDKGMTVLRLRSDHAGEHLSHALQMSGATVVDVVLYNNTLIHYDSLPGFDVAVFASSSAVDSFISQWGLNCLKAQIKVAIGKPTFETLKKHNCTHNAVIARETSIEACIFESALLMTQKKIS